MQDGVRGDFRERLSSLLLEMERTHPLNSREQRVSVGRCHLDAETFELLTQNFRAGQYSKGVMEGYAQVIGVTRPIDLQRSAQVVRQLRTDKGGHIVQVSAFQNDLDEIKRAASSADLTVPALLESCTYLFVRVGAR